MSTTLNTAVRPSFSTIVDTFQEAKTLFKGSGASLRLSGDSLHTKSSKPSRWGSNAAAQRKEKRNNASEFVKKALNEHFEKAGLGKGEGARLIFNLRHEGKISSDRITVKDLKTLNSHLEGHYTERFKQVMQEKTKTFDSFHNKQSLTVAVNKSRNEMAGFNQAGLNGLVQGTRWEMSDHGVGGAILVTGGNDVKSVLKFDGGNIENAEKCYKLLNAFRTGTDDPLPFVVPNMTVVSLATNTELRNEVNLKLGQEIESLKVKIQTAKNENKGDVEIKKLESKLERMEGKGFTKGIQDKLNASPNVIKMEMVPDSQQLNLLDVNTKHALLHSEHFGQNIGKSMVILQFLGFNDHLNIGTCGCTNFSNLMVNTQGHIHLIDPSMNQSKADKEKIGPNTEILSTQMLDVLKLLDRCGSKEEVKNCVEDLFLRNNDNQIKNLNLDGVGYPLTNLFFSMFETADGGGTFFYKERGMQEGKRDESSYLKGVTSETKQLFVANVMKGLLEGVRYLDRNRQGISTQIEGTKIDEKKVADYDSGVVLNEVNLKITEMGTEKLSNVETALSEYISDLKKLI